MKEVRGELQGQGLRIGIVVSRFNQFVTCSLLEGAREGLAKYGVRDEDAIILWVPGAFELPLAAKILARSGRYDAVICLGAVIRGETSHYDLVADQAGRGIGAASLETEVPIIFGVLTTENVDQAINRAGGKVGNKGYDAALVAIEMVRLLRTTRDLNP